MPPKELPKENVQKSASGKLNEEQLNEEMDVFLTVYNPYVSQNCVEFDRKSNCFKPVFDYKKPVVYYRNVGTTKRRLEGSYGIVYEEVPKEKPVRNSLDFRSVETQTDFIQNKDQNEYTDPTMFPVLKFQGSASKSEIMEAYEEHERKKQKEKDENYSSKHWFKCDLKVLLKFTGRRELMFDDKNRKYLRLLERVLDQNMSEEVNLDYTYYDNPTDELKPDSGSVLPLWKLSCKRTKGTRVTDIGWSPQHEDMLAVGYAGMEQKKDEDIVDIGREKGIVCVYSLKGPSHPENMLECPEGVSCLSFHPLLPNLLAVACTRGTVAVYDLKWKESNAPQGQDSKFQTWFHKDRVSEIEWFPDPVPQKFCSISCDGKLINWRFLVDDLFPSDLVTELQLEDWPLEAPPKGLEMYSELKAGENLGLNTIGTSLTVHPTKKDTFLVGTEKGLVHEGSFSDKRCYGDPFSGHKGRIGRVHWNRLHPGVFISCSTDFTLQVWDHTCGQSVFEFFFEHGVQDIAWAPYSTTVFAAITSRSMVSVFDLSLNKHEAVASHTVYTKKQNIELTTISFHPNKPVLAVGDERGNVIIFKLSPNVRASLKAMKTVEKSKFISGEIAKMDRLLAAAKVEVKNTNNTNY